MSYRLEHTTPKCTTDSCRATRNVTHLTFATREQASAFVQRYAIMNVRIVEAVAEQTTGHRTSHAQ